jgi:hypothetical protein
MNLIPRKRQWLEWSLPSKVSYIGFILAVLGIPLWVISYFWPQAPEIVSDQPQISIETTAKPFLRYSSLPNGGMEFSYELCIKNSGRNPAKNLEYTKAMQVLQIGGQNSVTVDSRPFLNAPKRIVSGGR